MLRARVQCGDVVDVELGWFVWLRTEEKKLNKNYLFLL